MSNGIIVDDKVVMKALMSLSIKQMNKAYKNGMKEALKPLLNQTRTNLRKSGIQGVSRPYVSKKTGKTYKSMMQGIKSTIHNVGNTQDDMYGNVHIMGEFRLKWFEMGTKLRKPNRGKKQGGAIKPYRFFEKAKKSTAEMIVSSLDNRLKTAILKAWESK